MKAAWNFPAFLAVTLLVSVSVAGEPIVRTYESPSGETFGSISVRLPEAAVRDQVDHVVLIDTSASQVGEHREMSLDVLNSFLNHLPPTHRAIVVAVDVDAVRITHEFAAPQTTAKLAIETLESRFPAGATNLSKGFNAALELLQSSEHGAITYLGDGMSAAHLLQLEETQQLTQQLRRQEIPVHSFAVGSNMDMQLLGVFGQETGGFVMRDEPGPHSLNAEDAGRVLAQAAGQRVVYPESVALSSEQVELLPNRPLPLRSDRETVYLFQGELAAGEKLSLGDLSLMIPQFQRTTGNAFLYTLWNNAISTDGIGLGLAGEWLVSLNHQQFEDGVLQMEMQGVQALNNGSFETAEKIGFTLQEIDPHNQTAIELINKAGEKMLLQTVQFGENEAVDNAVDQANQLNDDRTGPRPENALEAYKQLTTARTQQLRAQVELGIERANDVLDISPDAAISEIKRLNGMVSSATDVDPEARRQLLRRLSSTQQDFISQKAKILLANAERNKRLVEIEAQQRLIEYQEERDTKLEQMVDRIRALIQEGYEGDPGAFESAEAVGREVLSEYPNSAMGVSVVFAAEAAGQIDKAERLRHLRSDRFLETLYQVELSHVPFPDEPPVRYPPAEVWQALTLMREKWKSVDLQSNNPSEQKIYSALDQITNVEFPGNPLNDVIVYLESIHNIPILLDETALNDEGKSGDDEVVLVLSGITLRSALKLLLEPLDLTYVIEDEVMKITTITEAELTLKPKVYPVADLVIPIFPLGGGFGSGGGLGGGGFGGQQGGQQGGLGGQQGGFGGGQQGGFGQNQFSVPPKPIPGKKKPVLN